MFGWCWPLSTILSVYRDPQGCDIVATLSVAMISQSLRVAISFNSAIKILSFFVLFCDICQYRNKISDFFEHFLRYGKYRKKGQKSAKIFVALLFRITYFFGKLHKRGLNSESVHPGSNHPNLNIFPLSNALMRYKKSIAAE